MNMSNVTNAMRKVLPLGHCGAVIVAAGSASRMGGIDKVMAKLQGEPMIVRTVRAFQEAIATFRTMFLQPGELMLSDEELAARRAAWVCPEPKVKTGYLARYAKLVTSADKGAILN